MKNRFELLAALAVCLLAGCSDPADSVHKSPASEPTKAAPSSGTAAPSSGSAAASPGAASDSAAAAPAAATPPVGKTYVIRSGSTVGFTGSKVTGSHDGGFKNVAGSFSVHASKILGTPEIKIGMKSIFSDNEKLTGHLKSADFFDVEKHPVTTFTVTSIASAGLTNNVTGNLDLHGVSKSISFPAAIEINNDSVTVKAAFAINRKQWNINYAGKANDLIRDLVVIKLDLKATPGRPQPEDELAK